MLCELEDYTFGSWRSMELNLGEQYLLTTGTGDNTPTGTVSSVMSWSLVHKESVRNSVMHAFLRFMHDASERGMAWTGVHHSFAGDVQQQEGLRVDDVVRALLDNFLDSNSQGGLFPLPRCCFRSSSGGIVRGPVFPSVETVMDAEENLVACRVQMPLVPSAARLASAMLSSTVEGQRVVVHVKEVGDVRVSREAHAAPLFVALTRVHCIAHVALTMETKLNDHVFEARVPFEELPQQVQQWGQGQGFAKLYHCQAIGYDGGLAVANGSDDFDSEHHDQVEADFFD